MAFAGWYIVFGDLGFVAYAGKVFEFGFEWGFWVWLGFGVLLVFPQDWDFLPRYLNLPLSVFDGFWKIRKQRNEVKILRDGKYQVINLSCEIKLK